MSTSQQIINDIEPRSQYVSTNGQTVFNTTWTADSASDIDVYAHADGVEADDATQLVSTTEYNVTFVGTYETVRVTFTTGRVLDDIITIVRNTPSTRDNLYTNTNFTPSMLNQDFGVRTLVEQQNQMYNLDFAPHYNLSCTYTDNSDYAIDIILPILDSNQIWVKNLANTKIIALDLPESGDLPVAGPFITYTASATLANAFNMGLLGSGIIGQTVTDSVSTPYVLDIPLTVPNGGTGATTFDAYNVVLAGITETGALRTLADTGASGEVLTSNGAGADPSWQEISQVGSINIIEYTSDDTYTKPDNLSFITIKAVGGGAGGGGTANSNNPGYLITGGGSSGGYSESFYNAADVGATLAITIGAGGAGGASGGGEGGVGGQTSAGALCVANGGLSTVNIVGGIAPAAGTGNIIASTGSCGLPGVGTSLNTTDFSGGMGGSSIWGAGGNSTYQSMAGNPGTGYGSGGGGAASVNAGGAFAGGAGASGKVIIIEYLAG